MKAQKLMCDHHGVDGAKLCTALLRKSRTFCFKGKDEPMQESACWLSHGRQSPGKDEFHESLIASKRQQDLGLMELGFPKNG